jgi:hypothetical protein
MANKIKPRRSYTASSVPLTSDLDTHELAINWVDGKAFTKDAAGNIVSVTLGGGSYTLPTASSSTLGGVRVGSGLSISSGVLSVSDSRWDLFLPPASTGVTATAGNAQAIVSWTAPTVLAQTPITDYTVQYSSNSGSSWTTFTRSASTSTSATVTGLTNGTSYVFRVAAVTGVGSGSYSTASNSITAGGDTYYSSVSLLLHMNGTNGSTTFTDNSGTPKTVTAAYNAQISTARSQWGGASALFGGGDYLSVPSNSAWAFSGDFAVECWVYRTSAPGLLSIIGVGYQIFGLGIAINSSNSICVTRPGTAIDHTFAAGVPMNAWSHIAISRSGTNLRCYVDGVQKDSTQTNSRSYAQGELVIGMDGNKANQGFIGNIDDLRITASARGYTGSTIPVPSYAFQDS